MNALSLFNRAGLRLLAGFGLLGIFLVSPVTARAVTITVNSTNDPAGFNPAITIATLGSTVTLRDAMNAAINTGGTNTILFATNLAGATVGLLQDSAPMVPAAFGAALAIRGLAGDSGITIARTATNAFRLFRNNGILSLANLTLTGGSAGGGNGGAIENYGSLNLDGCTFSSNSANYGGAIHAGNGTITMSNTTITANQSTGGGGGINVEHSLIYATNVTVAGNHSFQGGGVRVGVRNPLFVNSIFSGNTATLNYPDINGFFNAASHNNLVNRSGNYPGGGGGNAAGGLVNGVNGTILDVNPLLGPLTNNGGPTPTLALLAGSPAINAGLTAAGLTTDQRGVIRVAPFDIGAFEFTDSVSPPRLTGLTKAPNGPFQFSFTNVPGASFTVLGSTNAALPLSNWTSLGAPIESPAGQYQFTDAQASNNVQRFYRVKSP